jgi:hypothetical protein
LKIGGSDDDLGGTASLAGAVGTPGRGRLLDWLGLIQGGAKLAEAMLVHSAAEVKDCGKMDHDAGH